MVGVYPAGTDAGIDAALNVGGEAVAHHQALGLVKAGNPGEGCFEILLGGLVVADFLGYEDLLEIVADIGALQGIGNLYTEESKTDVP